MSAHVALWKNPGWSHSNGVTSRSWMRHLAAGRHRSVMARPMRPSMLVGITRLHAAIATSTGRIARGLLFTTVSSHVKIFSVNSAQNRAPGRILVELRANLN